MSRETTWIRAQLGILLKRAREEAGLGAEEVAKSAGWSRQKLWGMEAGRGSYKPPEMQFLGLKYGLPATEVENLMDLARNADSPTWFESIGPAGPKEFGMYLSLESTATSLMSVNEELVNGLAQTEEYHRALMSVGDAPSAQEAEEQISFRRERQQRFWDGEAKLIVIMAQAALDHEIGGPEVTRRQLDHLCRLANGDRASIRVLPLGRGGHAPATAFTLLRGPFGIVAYMEDIDEGRTISKKDRVKKFARVATLAEASSIDIREWQVSSTSDWIKSTRSGQSGQCVEMKAAGGNVHIRDSKAPNDGRLTMPPVAFGDLLYAAKTGELDHLA